jgi:glutamyl-tRNA reductase
VAREIGTAGAVLEALIEEALRTARQVHLRTRLGRGRESLADIAVELLRERVQRTPSPVALIGVTPITRRCAELLMRDSVPFVVVNRTPAHAKAMVAELGAGQTLSLEQFRRRPPRIEAILTATSAPGPILERAALERLAARTTSQEPPLVVDLSIPPDVDPAVAVAVEIVRVGMDEISGTAMARHERRQQDAAAARLLVAEALGDLPHRLAERALAPVIRRINARFRETAFEGVERLLRHRGLGDALAADAAAREALERWAETLARRFAHLPTLGLRGLAAEHGMLAVQSFLDAGEVDLLASFGEIAAELEALAPGGERRPEPVRPERRRRRGT